MRVPTRRESWKYARERPAPPADGTERRATTRRAGRAGRAPARTKFAGDVLGPFESHAGEDAGRNAEAGRAAQPRGPRARPAGLCRQARHGVARRAPAPASAPMASGGRADPAAVAKRA